MFGCLVRCRPFGGKQLGRCLALNVLHCLPHHIPHNPVDSPTSPRLTHVNLLAMASQCLLLDMHKTVPWSKRLKLPSTGFTCLSLPAGLGTTYLDPWAPGNVHHHPHSPHFLQAMTKAKGQGIVTVRNDYHMGPEQQVAQAFLQNNNDKNHSMNSDTVNRNWV